MDRGAQQATVHGIAKRQTPDTSEWLTHAHTLTHTHTHTYTHSPTHTHSHTYSHTLTHSHTHSHTYTLTHTFTHSHTHTHTHTHTVQISLKCSALHPPCLIINLLNISLFLCILSDTVSQSLICNSKIQRAEKWKIYLAVKYKVTWTCLQSCPELRRLSSVMFTRLSEWVLETSMSPHLMYNMLVTFLQSKNPEFWNASGPGISNKGLWTHFWMDFFF